MKFKIGDKVELIEDYDTYKKGYSFVISTIIPSHGYYNKGDLCYDNEDDLYYGIDFKGCYAKRLKLCVKTLDNLEVGDIVIDNEGLEHKVHALVGLLVFISEFDNFNIASTYFTIEELKEKEYTVKQNETVEDITELTLEDVAKLANVSVDKLRIKD